MTTMNVKNASGGTEAIEKPLTPGRAAAAASRPVVLSTEDKTAIDAIASQVTLAAVLAKIIAAPATEAKQDAGNTSLASIDGKMSILAGYVDGLEALATALNGYVAGLEGKDFATQTTLGEILTALGAPLAAGTALIGKVDHSTTGTEDGRKVVTAAGTAEALAVSTVAKFVEITAETDNTGIIVVGGSTVVAALATRRGRPLLPGESTTLPISNLSNVYIDATVSGDGVTYVYGT
ncbi:hypothetical protein RA307_31365 [Xanthobacteraceae bacterium Astr-EGSB]|uniref:hypothetical protein n=1 Tax=Astrobacterium formosum TaxID=3069710 RepID=UPI0027B207BB|nr:hypothetical protein [Xanthobacteraceae bacterium Astr-EGSB]